MDDATRSLLTRSIRVRDRLARRVEAIQYTYDDEMFWRVFHLYQRACRLELRLIYRADGRALPRELDPQHVVAAEAHVFALPETAANTTSCGRSRQSARFRPHRPMSWF